MKETIDEKLLARYLSGECSEEEHIKVERWLSAERKNQQMLEIMRVAWNIPEPQHQTSDVKKLWSQVAEKANITPKSNEQTNRKSRILNWPFNFQTSTYRILRYAAILLVAISLGYFFTKGVEIFPWGKQPSALQTLIVENGKRQSITLSDGTTIKLDAGSKLRYPDEFMGNTREVYLEGEGYFEVVSDPIKPFIVHANYAEVKVLGTKFNVRAWQKDRKVSVAVAEGRVSLQQEQSASQSKVVILKGQSSTLTENGQPTEPKPVDISKILGWMNNELFFDNVPLGEVLFQLERWYDVQFILADSSIAAERLALHMQSDSIDEVLQLISALTDLNYKHSGKSIHLTSGKINEN